MSLPAPSRSIRYLAGHRASSAPPPAPASQSRPLTALRVSTCRAQSRAALRLPPVNATYVPSTHGRALTAFAGPLGRGGASGGVPEPLDRADEVIVTFRHRRHHVAVASPAPSQRIHGASENAACGGACLDAKQVNQLIVMCQFDSDYVVRPGLKCRRGTSRGGSGGHQLPLWDPGGDAAGCRPL